MGTKYAATEHTTKFFKLLDAYAELNGGDYSKAHYDAAHHESNPIELYAAAERKLREIDKRRQQEPLDIPVVQTHQNAL